MRQYRLLILAIVISWMVTACNNFLEEKSQDEAIPEAATDFREILLHYQATPFTPVLYVLDDDVVMIETYFSDDKDNSEAVSLAGSLTWQPDIWERANTLEDNYGAVYEDIMGMNAILAEIDDATGSIEAIEMVKAQTLAMRAYHYFMLVNTYGEPYNYNKDALGVVLKLDVPYVEGGMARTSVGKVYGQIVEDLETASALLNKYPKTRGDYLMNSTSTDILLSRVYLYMEEWDKAVEAASRAIGSAEGLFDYNTIDEQLGLLSFTYDISEVECLFGLVAYPTYDVRPTEDLLSLFDKNDNRLKFIYVKCPWDFFGREPIVWIRSAEAYLNRAEARVLADAQDLEGALEDLNELRRHRIANYTDVNYTDVETLLTEIRNERRKELCFEGHRWFDLRRYGMPSITRDFRTRLSTPLLRYTLKEKDPFYTLPIPKDIMENNNKLEQNPSAFAPERIGVPIQ